jgi:small Trp-rich protein
MPLAIICLIILAMKLLEVRPVADWSWWWVMAPFALLFFWWEVGSKWVGWDKKAAEKKMKEEEKIAQETKRKNRGF